MCVIKGGSREKLLRITSPLRQIRFSYMYIKELFLCSTENCLSAAPVIHCSGSALVVVLVRLKEYQNVCVSVGRCAFTGVVLALSSIHLCCFVSCRYARLVPRRMTFCWVSRYRSLVKRDIILPPLPICEVREKDNSNDQNNSNVECIKLKIYWYSF